MPVNLVVPLYDDSGGELVNLQLISAHGEVHPQGGQVRGTSHTLEGQNQAGKRLWIAEGYATALTVHHLTGETVMVALSSANLLWPALPGRASGLSRLSLPQTVTSAVTAEPPSRRCVVLLPCRRSSVTGTTPSRSTAGQRPKAIFMMPSGHRLKARSTP